MSFEWFLITLPIVFLLGWFAARIDIRHIRKTAGELPRAYLHGLSHLLKNEKKQALEYFLSAQPLDPESVELQFAIGELSRNQGEYRQAIVVHEKLCQNETLDTDSRRRARWELANDYFNMGFFDIAEKHAKRLVEQQQYLEPASNMLLDIFQRFRNYERALAVINALPADGALLHRKTAAYLLCEQAYRLPAEQFDQKYNLLCRALSTDGQCARANILLGDLMKSAERYDDAINYYAAVENQNASFLWQAAAGLLDAYQKNNNINSGCEKLRLWLKTHPSPILFDTVYHLLAARQKAANVAANGVQQGLGLVAAAAWATEQKQSATPQQTEFWTALEKTLSANAIWRCQSCDYRANQFEWQCYNCLCWESFVSSSQR